MKRRWRTAGGWGILAARRVRPNFLAIQVLLCLAISLVSLSGGQKVIYSNPGGNGEVAVPQKSFLPESGTFFYEFLDRKSSVGGVGALSVPAPPEISKKEQNKRFLELFDRKKDWVLHAREDLDRMTDPAVVLGVEGYYHKEKKANQESVSGRYADQASSSWDTGSTGAAFSPDGTAPVLSNSARQTASGPLFRLKPFSGAEADSESDDGGLGLPGGSTRPLTSALSSVSSFLSQRQGSSSYGSSLGNLFGAPGRAKLDMRATERKVHEEQFRQMLQSSGVEKPLANALDPLNRFQQDTTRLEMTPVTGRSPEEAVAPPALTPLEAWNKAHGLRQGSRSSFTSVFENGEPRSIGSLGSPSPSAEPSAESSWMQPKPAVLGWPKRRF